MRGANSPALRFAITRERTFVAKGGLVFEFVKNAAPERIAVDAPSGHPAFAVNTRYRYWAAGGRISRRPLSAAADSIAALVAREEGAAIGEALEGQTRLWAGERFGLGFYRAGELTVGFVFDAARGGLKDSILLPVPRGRLLDARATFDDDRAFLFFAFAQGGALVHRAVAISAEGRILGAAEASAGDGSWLGSLRGQCAAGGALFSATDRGVARVELAQGGLVEVRRFDETAPFVTSESEILATPKGLFVVGQRDIALLRIV